MKVLQKILGTFKDMICSDVRRLKKGQDGSHRILNFVVFLKCGNWINTQLY